jgi:hypothetical protein
VFATYSYMLSAPAGTITQEAAGVNQKRFSVQPCNVAPDGVSCGDSTGSQC